MTPLISVVVPVYNAEKYLRECLDSVIDQSLREIEIICVDDGSTDASPAILAEYAARDPRVRVITQENRYAGAARNAGMKIARGDYLSFLDADDVFEPDMLRKMFLDAETRGADVVICRADRFSVSLEARTPASWTVRTELLDVPATTVFSYKNFRRDAFSFCIGWTWDKLFSRRFVEAQGLTFSETRSTNDAYFTFLAVLFARRITFVDRVLVHQRMHSASLSSTREKDPLCYWQVVRDMKREILARPGLWDEVGDAFMRWLAGFVLWQAESLAPDARERQIAYFRDVAAPEFGLLPWLDLNAFTPEMRRVRSWLTDAPPPPFVSVVVPVYNVEKYLRQCLDSVVNQTLKEIEIICVDDGSTDSSPQILEEYAARDPRIKMIRQGNLGTSQTRKNGVAASKGAFLMFLDGDDEFVPTACEKAFAAAIRSRADIVQFGTEIVNAAGVSRERIAMNERMLEPFLGGLDHENLAESCWIKKKISGNLWNKIFRGDLARKAFDCVEDGYFPRAQDWYAFFIIAYLSRSYFGIAEKLYRYNFGIGVIGGNNLTMRRFEALLSQKKVFEALKSFLRKRDDGKHYQNSLETIRNIFLGQCLHAWQSKLSKEDAVAALPKLIDTWGIEEVLLSFAKSNWDSYFDFSETRLSAFALNARKERKRSKTIAFYYRCIANGGAQRVVADLCNRFAGKKDDKGDYAFNVVCITDSEFSGIKGDYPLSARVARAYLPAYAKSSREKYRERFRAWHEIISEHEIDVVVSGLWTEPVTFWDALCVKGHPRRPYFLTHSHSYNAIPYLFGEKAPKRIDALYRVSDGVVALSDCDSRHIEKINPRVRAIVNPLASDPRKIGESSREANSVVWVGRISGEKRPLDAVRMMKRVVAEIPDAKLRLVGGGDENLTRAITKLVHDLGLRNNVELVGFTHDVAAYYSKASVFVSTAEYEGFPLTFGEATAHGVPIVSYEMPWLTFMRDGRGIVPVERLSPDALAREVVRLLKNPAEARELGMRGREQIIEINDVDIVAEWKNLFDEIAGVPVDKRERSREECAELDAINERFVGVFRRMREERERAGNVASPMVLPRFVVRLGALFILNKAARKRWRARHMDLTPRDGVDVRALSSQELAHLREAKRSRSVLRRVFDALVPATRGKIAHAERHLLRASEERTRLLLDELRRVREDAAETRRELARMREEQERSREELLLRMLALSRAFAVASAREPLDEPSPTGADSPRVAACRNPPESAASCKDAAYYERVPVAERERELKLWFRLRNGYDLDLENPKTFNEKIQWLKLYDSTPLKTRLADKYEARAWIKERIGEKYLVPLLGVWDSFDEIDFDKLPEKFVLKMTHGSGYNIIVKDKSKFDKADAKKKFDEWLSRKFEYCACFEMHYAGIKPRVIAEEFLDVDEDGAYEWQAFCFNGKPRFVLVIEGGAHADVPGRRYYYDLNWKKLPFTSLADRLPEGEIKIPERFAEFMDCAKKLAADFLHVRVDFYLLRDGTWKAGEMTFTTASGCLRIYPKSYDRVIGDMLELPTSRS